MQLNKIAIEIFFPLTVNYNEKTYAAGKIPGGFFKREGRPSEKETLISRLIDRPLRPLFDSSYKREVQLVVTLISYNPDVDPEVPALIASSVAVKLSGLPFNGTLGAVKVGYDGENYLLNPRTPELKASLLDLTVAGTESAVMMVESEAKELSEEIMLGAVKYGHEQMQTIIKAIDEFTAEVGVDKLEWNPEKMDDAAYMSLKDKYKDKISEAYSITKKQDRNESLSKIKEEILANELNEESDNESDILSYYSKAQKSIVRDRIICR